MDEEVECCWNGHIDQGYCGDKMSNECRILYRKKGNMKSIFMRVVVAVRRQKNPNKNRTNGNVDNVFLLFFFGVWLLLGIDVCAQCTYTYSCVRKCSHRVYCVYSQTETETCMVR